MIKENDYIHTSKPLVDKSVPKLVGNVIHGIIHKVLRRDLLHPHRLVQAAQLDKLIMRTLLHDLAVLQDDNEIRLNDRSEAMCDEYTCA